MYPKLTGLSVSGVSTIGITTTDVLHAKTFSSSGIITTRGGLDLKGKFMIVLIKLVQQLQF